MSFEEMAKSLNVSKRSFPRVLQEQGINTRLKNRYTIEHEDYFEQIDTEFKAYILGFIFADGFVGTHNDFCMALSHNCDDNLRILERLRNEIGITLDIKHYVSKDGVGSYTLKFSNRKIVDALNKLGVFTCKSLIDKHVPVLPNELYCHFIRGYFDGNGTIYSYYDNYDNRRRIVFSIMGTPIFINEIKEILVKQCNIKRVSSKKVRNIEGLYSFEYKGIKSITQIKNYLYNEATIYINYKHDRFYKQPL